MTYLVIHLGITHSTVLSVKVSYNNNCMSLFKKNKVLTVWDQVSLENVKLMYKLEAGLCLSPIMNCYVRSNHNYSTR